MQGDLTRETILQKGYMQLSARIEESKLDILQPDLLKAADETQIHTFGWPIGVVLHVDQHKPRPLTDGIEAEIQTESHYDYWSLKKNGDYYYLGSLFEDTRKEGKLFFDTRANRITEAIWRVGRLYRALGVSGADTLVLEIKHGGLKDRELTVASASREMFEKRICHETRPAVTHMTITLRDIVDDTNNVNVKSMQSLVYRAILDLSMLFDFFQPKQSVVDEIVESFIRGRIS